MNWSAANQLCPHLLKQHVTLYTIYVSESRHCKVSEFQLYFPNWMRTHVSVCVCVCVYVYYCACVCVCPCCECMRIQSMSQIDIRSGTHLLSFWNIHVGNGRAEFVLEMGFVEISRIHFSSILWILCYVIYGNRVLINEWSARFCNSGGKGR